jgi:hypothetical protein
MDDTEQQSPHRQTRVMKTLWPRQAGTLKLLRRFGADLVCVQIVVDQSCVASRRSDRQVFGVRIGLLEHDLRAQAKAHGAKWDDTSKLWRMRGKGVKLLKLHARVVKK